MKCGGSWRRGAIGTISGALARHSHGGPEVYYAEVADAFEEPRVENDLWFFDADTAGGGALIDMGVYSVANLVALLGKVDYVTARMTTVAKPTALEDTATLILEFANGALATTETGWCDPARSSFLRVHGTAGKLVLRGDVIDYIRPSSYDREWRRQLWMRFHWRRWSTSTKSGFAASRAALSRKSRTFGRRVTSAKLCLPLSSRVKHVRASRFTRIRGQTKAKTVIVRRPER